ncbi:acetate/propionate family kinase [Nonomuraea gerenzanensis]|uniref:Acetate kinase n=1 Tax=Nonomuraea gerenzanensis TaxID=93944 RepID=A0A1M4E8K4_9ACTN|nr:acetate kinase [Nonomuraea gerenzanensis]UBU17461.1 acetate kinase [Nonomuraea gerenzanensis]SBO95217.1 Acetate kinase [Nonomuraea gerenzanensis]
MDERVEESAAILTVNAGSSSLRLDLVQGGSVLDSAHAERAVDPGSARQELSAFLGGHFDRDIRAVAHRLVHGGDVVRVPTVADEETAEALRAVTGLAPLHLPPALALLEAAREQLPAVPHVLCPDTAFHAGLPDEAAVYALPAGWRERYGLRRYGFHGLSYAWAADRACELLGRPLHELDLVLAHLGGGCSVAAVSGGRSLDTSMGFTPLDGLPMSKRSGSVDPGMLVWLLRQGHLALEELGEGLERHSGLLGLSGGRSGDTRELVAAERDGDEAAGLALRVFAHRVSREIAAAATSLRRVDALVFTGEIGWDQPEVREAVCRRLGLLGIEPPGAGNRPDDGPVSPAGAAVPVLVVQVREELQLARECLAMLAEEEA